MVKPLPLNSSFSTKMTSLYQHISGTIIKVLYVKDGFASFDIIKPRNVKHNSNIIPVAVLEKEFRLLT